MKRDWASVALFLLLAGCGVDIVEREMESFTVGIPDDWTVRTERQGGQVYLFGAPPGFTAVNYRFAAVEMPADPDVGLAEWAHTVFAQLQFNIGNSKDIQAVDGTVGGEPARIITSIDIDQGESFDVKMVFIRRGKRGVVMCGQHPQGDKEWVEDVEEILNSFRFKSDVPG